MKPLVGWVDEQETQHYQLCKRSRFNSTTRFTIVYATSNCFNAYTSVIMPASESVHQNDERDENRALENGAIAMHVAIARILMGLFEKRWKVTTTAHYAQNFNSAIQNSVENDVPFQR
jgi:hypothetical protein